MSYIACPFCGDTDFDLQGLAHHLRAYCEAYSVALDAFDEDERKFREELLKRREEKS